MTNPPSRRWRRWIRWPRSARDRKFRWSSCVMIRKSRSISPSRNTRPPTKRLPVWGATLIAKYRTGGNLTRNPVSMNAGQKKAGTAVPALLLGRDYLLTKSSPSAISFFRVSSMPSSACCSKALSLPIDCRSSTPFSPAAAAGRRNAHSGRRLPRRRTPPRLFPLHGANQRETKTGSRLAHRQGRRPAARFRFHDFSTGVLNTFSQVGNFLIAKADAGDLRQ